MEKIKAIKTELGEIHGRDAIFLDDMVELDVSLQMFDNLYNESSRFGELFNTKILRDIKNARDLELKQYVIYTYDDVFVIACQEFELRLQK
ncbi:hypothetical protein L3476_08540 [Paenibacillus thiaminolyticus]|uniref:hypothetical protein n=1 Tax=Paenibacillus thiaminolyticus TaxID=49283 RepID=UPI0023503CA5|nr:hypothetical protein [Paenibacillus thiaminolyticus]WCR28761.1 hypothetical protein L3476_08540 [Paenibacillus thiaminolyticus]